MSYLPNTRFVTPMTISTANIQGFNQLTAEQAPLSSNYPTTNLALYFPVAIRQPCTINAFFAINAGAVAGHFDLGIYTKAGVKVVSTGSTAQAGTSQPQTASVTATTIGPGLYYLAIASDTSGATAKYAAWTTFSGGVGASGLKMYGIYQQATAFTLPATATFATNASTFVPLIGMVLAPNTTV